MHTDLTFGNWLKLRRRGLGWTQAQLGQRIGYAGETIRKVEADELRPSRQLAEKLAEALGIAPAERATFLRFARDEPGSEDIALPTQSAALPQPSARSPHSLPLPRDPLIGRTREVAAVQQRLLRSSVALVTLAGPGGVGKTRLALQVAANLQDRFSDGVHFIPLAAIDDPTLVVSTISQALDVREAEGQPLLERLKTRLHDKQMLLVLDNFEQVAAAGPLLSELLQAAPQLKVLVTSRVVLHLRAEHTFAVPPLAVPDLNPGGAQTTPKDEADIARLLQFAAIRLFVERAQSTQADFAVTSANASAIAELCHHLDGLPLAIELAAARIRLLSPQAMLTRLEHQLQFLTGGARDAPARQQTLQATLDWSYALLEQAEKILFRRLAVFTGCTLASVEATCNADGALPDVLEGLRSLIDKSLLQPKADEDGEPRFGLLRVIREYALERLAESGEMEGMRRRHAHFFLALAEAAEPQLMRAEQQAWLGRLAMEYDNLRAALEACIAEDDVEIGLRLGGALWRFWEVRGYLGEGRHWLERVLARDPEHGGPPGAACTGRRAKALAGAGRLACNQGDYAAARMFHEESLALFWKLGDKRGVAFSLNNQGNVALNQGNYGAARVLHEESLVLFRETGDKWGIAAALNNLGIVAVEQGDYNAARVLHAESLVIKREMGDKQGVAASLNNLGTVALNQGDYNAARVLLEESLAMKREVGDKQGIAFSLNNLGNIALNQGDYRAARTLLEESLAQQRAIGNKRGAALALNNLGEVAYYEGDGRAACLLYEESLAIRREVGDKQGIAECLVGLAGVARMHQQPERSARLLGATQALLNAIDGCLETTERALYEHNVTAVETVLGKEQFDAAWAIGRAMTLDEVVTYALATAQPFQ
jgi:predicted ATPase/transcriptional regulator with XRE-family HTH domain/Tfp pilus assembly protein PilF